MMPAGLRQVTSDGRLVVRSPSVFGYQQTSDSETDHATLETIDFRTNRGGESPR
jgi:hypothetical protein